MASNKTVVDIVKEMVEFGNHCAAFGGAYSPERWDNLCKRLIAANKRECDKYKDHINELNRQILMLKHEREKRETYLCGYDPDEALVMQCGTCCFFQKKHSHCSHNDSLTNAKYKCKDWKFKTNEKCVKEASKKHDEEIVRLWRDIAALEHKYANACKCCDDSERRLKIAEDALEKIDNMCDGDLCKHFDNTHHCSACRYLDECQTGVAHAALHEIREKGENNDK